MEYAMYSNDALQQSTNIKPRKYGSVWKWSMGFRWAEGSWILLGFGNEILFVSFTGLDFFRERSRHKHSIKFDTNSEEQSGWFIPGFLCCNEFSSVSFWRETASKHLWVPVQSNTTKSFLLGHFIYFNKINKWEQL